MEWVQQHALAIQAIGAAIQAIAAVAIGVLTWRLAESTSLYVNSTADALRLSRQQFERQLLPKLYVTLILDGANVRLQIFNLSLCPVVLDTLYIGTDEDDAVRKHFIEIPAPSEKAAVSDDVTDLVIEAARPHMRAGLWAGALRIRMSYVLEGIDRPTGWIRYQVRIEDGRVTEANRRRADVIIQPEAPADARPQ